MMRLPGTTWIRKLGQIGRRDRLRAKTWDGLYKTKETERYTALEQFARYALIEGYCKATHPQADILEVGCGTGILLGRMDPRLVRSYCGIDVSHTAIEEARRLHPAAVFFCGDAESFDRPGGSFDIVIFNESLYCLNDMETGFRRHLHFLRPGGHAVVSITGLRPDAQSLFESLVSPQIVSQTTAHDRQSGKSWSIYLVSRDPASGATGGSG